MKRDRSETLVDDTPRKILKVLESDQLQPIDSQEITPDEITRNIRIMKQLLKSSMPLENSNRNNGADQSSKSITPVLPSFKPIVISHNWFNLSTNSQTPKNTKSPDRYVALDCQFVQCGNKHALACISIVSDTSDVLIHTFVKPTERITNYVTFVSGVTYELIKHAPSWLELRPKVESILKNTILVGHTISSDLKVMEMEMWSGFKSIVDIAKIPTFKDEENRVQSLKKMALKYLGKTIQTGSHSSLEDAKTTMDLFLLHRSQTSKDLRAY